MKFFSRSGFTGGLLCCLSIVLVAVTLNCFRTFGTFLLHREEQQLHRVRCSKSLYQLGTGLPDSTVRGTINVINEGAAAISVTVEPTCGCTVVDKRVLTVAGGGVESLEVGVHLHAAPNSSRRARVIFRPVDAPQSAFSCFVEAKTIESLSGTPASINLGNCSQDLINTSRAEIILRSAGGQKIEGLEGLSVVAGRPETRVSLILNTEGFACLEISFGSGIRPGRFTDTVEVRLEGDPIPFRLPVCVNLVDSERIVPTKVHLKKGQGVWTGQFLVVTSEARRIDRVECPEGVNARFLEGEFSRTAQIQVEANGGVQLPATLQVFIRDRKEPLTVVLRD